MNAVYDHIVAIVFIGIMFVWAVGVIPAMSFNNIQAANDQQLRSTELNVFNTLLLDTGLALNGTVETPEWGSLNPFDESDVVRFGLALHQDSSLFSLDPDKVQRLVGSNPMGNITYAQTKELLGLDGYDFQLHILPPFNVTNVDGTNLDANSPINDAKLDIGELEYEVKVSYLDGRPIPNAVVHATTVYTKGQSFYILNPSVSSTDAMGILNNTATLAVIDPDSLMVALRVTVADVATIVVTLERQTSGIIDINVVNDEVILTEPKIPNNAAIWLMNMYYYSSSGSLPLLYPGGKIQENKVNTGQGRFELWSKEFPGLKSLEPIFMVLDVEAVDDGRRQLVVCGPYQNLLGHTLFEFGPPHQGNSAAVRTQRSVVISGMTYIAELILWESQ